MTWYMTTYTNDKISFVCIKIKRPQKQHMVKNVATEYM